MSSSRQAFPIPADVGDDCTPFIHALHPVYFADPSFPIPPEIDATKCSRSTLSASYEASINAGFDHTAALRSLAAPAHVLFGGQDAYGLEWQATTATALSSAAPTVTTIPAAGHYPWMDAREATLAALRSFYAARTNLFSKDAAR